MHKFFRYLIVILATLSLGIADRTQAASQGGASTSIRQQNYRPRVQPAQRKAAAVRRGIKRIGAAAMLPPGSTPDYFNCANWTNSPLPTVNPVNGSITGGIRKFIDTLPGLGPGNSNNLGQYIPIATADSNSYPGCDYYQIGVADYTQQMHSDLPATHLRGYVDLGGGDGRPHYLGPLIITQRGTPVRIKFTNLLGTGAAGNLFLPVDTSAMGAGTGPLMMQTGDPELYTQNRAVLHLHGGDTPWISDGTPHQWITPAGETTSYPKGISQQNVPDMPDPGDGSATYYYPNGESNRLMFYHDHSYGMTRLNVYAGEAAGYLLTDPVEETLINQGLLPDLGGVYRYGIPLIIQDKTFVPDPATLAATDPTWDIANWGGMGNLWFPHVYMPNQNPNDMMGVNQFGRWDYGPWFWPPVTTLNHPPIPSSVTGGPEIPGTPNPSMVPEAFMDTPIVNGTAYPVLQVQRKAYRFRILNACNDRSLNLQLYYSDPAIPQGSVGYGTEVKMVPATLNANWPASWPTDGRDGGVPDPTTSGPSMIQIGTEGGFLQAPVVLPNTPIGYVYNRRDITVLNVSNKTLLLGPAERADVIVDFSGAPDGAKLILYNDSPAPVPAFDPRYDYYTGDIDQTSTGGAPTTQAGYGPNTRTIMQFDVSSPTADPAFDLPALQAAWPAAYAADQPAPLVPANTYAKIQDMTLTYTPAGSTTPVAVDMQPKAIQELFELDYGRMNATLGVELPFTNFNTQTTIPYGYIDPPTEILKDGEMQLWKITHNGVDTHAIHFHLFNVQLINRVGWDGMIKPPDPNEMGWKDTVRMNPLEDAIIALRPIKPNVPFDLPDSIRPLDVTMPVGSTMGFSTVGPDGLPVAINNPLTNFGSEYVWHCHLLGHEENDMMRPVVFQIAPGRPTSVSAVPKANSSATISFSPPIGTGGSPITSYTVTASAGGQTATGAASPITISGLNTGAAYTFTVTATNAVGTGPASNPSNQITFPPSVPGAPTIGTAIGGNAQATVSFTPPASDGGSPITGYTVTSSPGGKTGTGTSSPITVTGLTNGTAYTFTVTATNGQGTGPASNPSNSVTPATVPGAPTIGTATGGNAQATVSFTPPTSNGGNAITGYTVTSSPGGKTGSGTTSPITVTGLTNGTAYTFTVTATNGVGTGPASGPSNSVTLATVPGAPTIGTVIRGNAQVTVNFTPPASNGGSAITGYTATSSPGGKTGTGLSTASSIIVTGLTNGTAYTFTVTATNGVGTGPASSPSASVTPATLPGAPTIGTGIPGSGQATVSFTPPASNGGSAITGYTVTSSPGGKTGSGTASPITVTGLTNGLTYTFTVTATNNVGIGPASAPTANVSLTPPAAPSTLKATPSVLSVNAPTVSLTWVDNASNETGFTLQRATNSGFTAGLTSFAIGANLTVFTDSTVSTKVQYFYRLLASNALGSSAYSNTANTTTPGRLPAAPTNLAFVSATKTSIKISWADNANNEQGFYVERSTAGATGPWTRIATVAANTTSYTNSSTVFSPMKSNTSYWYRVQAYNADGTSTYSNVLAAKTNP